MTEHRIAPGDVGPEVMAAKDSLNDYRRGELDELLDSSLYSQTVFGDNPVQYALLDSGYHGGVDTSKVIVMPHPYGNGWKKHMLLRAMMLHGSLDVPHPVLALPSPTAFSSPFKLNQAQQQRLKERGDMSPIADIHAAIAEHVQKRYGSEEVSFLIDGYSQGASVGAVLAGKIATTHALLTEAPNVSSRKSGNHREEKKALSAAFKKGGLGPLNRAVAASDMPELLNAQGLTTSGRTSAKQLLAIAALGLGSLRRDNTLLTHAMAHATFRNDLRESLESQPDMQVTIARAIGSALLTAEQFRNIQLTFDGSTQLSYAALDSDDNKPYGHAAGDNLLIHSELFRRTVTNQLVS